MGRGYLLLQSEFTTGHMDRQDSAHTAKRKIVGHVTEIRFPHQTTTTSVANISYFCQNMFVPTEHYF